MEGRTHVLLRLGGGGGRCWGYGHGRTALMAELSVRDVRLAAPRAIDGIGSDPHRHRSGHRLHPSPGQLECARELGRKCGHSPGRATGREDSISDRGRQDSEPKDRHDRSDADGAVRAETGARSRVCSTGRETNEAGKVDPRYRTMGGNEIDPKQEDGDPEKNGNDMAEIHPAEGDSGPLF